MGGLSAAQTESTTGGSDRRERAMLLLSGAACGAVAGLVVALVAAGPLAHLVEFGWRWFRESVLGHDDEVDFELLLQ